MLERVRRQVDQIPLGGGDRVPVDVGGAECGENGGRLVASPAQCGGEGALGRLLGLCGENAVGAELDERGHATRLQLLDGVVETDRRADLGDPVLGVGQVAVDGHGRDDRDPRCGVGEGTGHGAEVVEHRIHVVRVERVADRQLLGLAVGEVGGDLRRVVAGDDDGAGAVDGGDADRVVEVGGDFFFGGFDGGHGAGVGEGVHEGGAGGDELGRVGEGEDAGDVGGGDLADGVADQVVGGDAPRLVQAVEGRFQREECGLCVERSVEEAGLSEEDRPQALVTEVGVHRVDRRFEGFAEHRVRRVEFLAHAGAL
ncbi:hypothetical protein Sgri01_07234 [Streptomyces griseus]